MQPECFAGMLMLNTLYMVTLNPSQSRQLGYIEGLPWSWSHFGEVKPPVFSMDEMRCTGDEEHLQDCIYNNHDDYCDSDDAAGVYV